MSMIEKAGLLLFISAIAASIAIVITNCRDLGTLIITVIVMYVSAFMFLFMGEDKK